ncbi:MAG TPA: NAD-dependent epimerase/dehydratase family protein [Anaeromyxobacter sp.]
MRVLVAGCGWLGKEIARRLVARGDRVTGVRRDPGRAASLASIGVTPLAVDLAAAGSERLLPDVDAVVACQSAASDAEGDYRSAYLAANRALLAAAERARARAFVYTGSTGVFGQEDGSDVDEGSPPRPASANARVLAEAERLVLSAAGRGIRSSVVRLSGLYGPGRAGIVDRVRSGALALGPGDEAWMNFCHLEDAAAFVLAALDRAGAGAIHHGSDAHPARRREVVEWIAARLGTAPPRAEKGRPGPNRRVLSAATREALGVALAYPSFREGLLALVPPAAGGAR